MRHMSGNVWGVFERPVRMHRGNTMAGCIKDERYHNPNREFVGGYFMQTEHLGPSFLAANLARSIDLKGWGSDFTRIMDAYEYIAGMWLVGEDMPQKTNCVTLHPTEKDQFGIPIPNVHFDDHANDIAMRDHAYKRGAMVYDSVGAARIIRVPPGPSTHNLGKAATRMPNPFNQRSLAIREKALGPEHPNVATVLENYAFLLRKMNRSEEVGSLEARAMAIRAKRAWASHVPLNLRL